MVPVLCISSRQNPEDRILICINPFLTPQTKSQTKLVYTTSALNKETLKYAPHNTHNKQSISDQNRYKSQSLAHPKYPYLQASSINFVLSSLFNWLQLNLLPAEKLQKFVTSGSDLKNSEIHSSRFYS